MIDWQAACDGWGWACEFLVAPGGATGRADRRIDVDPDRQRGKDMDLPVFELGWDGDGGLGERLCQEVVDGAKTATCAPKGGFTAEELADAYAARGRLHALVDPRGRVWGSIRVVDVFETPFGEPDPRLVRGEGYGDDAEAFRQAHVDAWVAYLARGGHSLTGETVLIAELFALVEDVV